jgi:hypothetical protein
MSKVAREINYNIPRIGMCFDAIPNLSPPSHNISSSLQGLINHRLKNLLTRVNT